MNPFLICKSAYDRLLDHYIDRLTNRFFVLKVSKHGESSLQGRDQKAIHSLLKSGLLALQYELRLNVMKLTIILGVMSVVMFLLSGG